MCPGMSKIVGGLGVFVGGTEVTEMVTKQTDFTEFHVLGTSAPKFLPSTCYMWFPSARLG